MVAETRVVVAAVTRTETSGPGGKSGGEAGKNTTVTARGVLEGMVVGGSGAHHHQKEQEEQSGKCACSK